MISKLGLLAVLIAASGISAAGAMPKPGSYGFNWLDPKSDCKKVTKQDVASFKKCTVTPNAFGLELRSHMCEVDARTEIVVYENAAQCQEALETMQANGE